MREPSEATNRRLGYVFAGMGLGCALTCIVLEVWPRVHVLVGIGVYLVVVSMLTNDHADDQERAEK